MNTSDYAIHAFSALSPIFQDFPRCTPSSLDFVYKAETSVQRVVPVANFHFSASSALSAFSVQCEAWDAFCMTTGGTHDNGLPAGKVGQSAATSLRRGSNPQSVRR
jgi:hypothetical protein